MKQERATGEIDLLLLCGARPQLLLQTLQSFSHNVFCNFRILNVFANIDRFMGDDKEVSEVEALILSYFAKAIIYKSDEPSFTKGVMRLWSLVSTDYCLHLEDDWVAQSAISDQTIFPHFKGNVAQVSIATAEKNWSRGQPYHCKWQRRRILGLGLGRSYRHDEPAFTTSPSFISGAFVRMCASLMNPDLDPEKQLNDGSNAGLRAFVKAYRNRVVGNGAAFLIRDIGRDFRHKQGLEKIIIGGQSIWIDGSSIISDKAAK